MISKILITQNIVNGRRNSTETEFLFKKCDLSDFGQNYQSILANKDLSQMICPNFTNFVLEGY